MFFCYKQKKMDNFLDNQLLCLLYLPYLLYPGRLCRGDHTNERKLEADSNPANGIILMFYTAVFWGASGVIRIILGVFYAA